MFIDKIKEKVVAQDEVLETVVRYIHRNQMIIETKDNITSKNNNSIFTRIINKIKGGNFYGIIF